MIIEICNIYENNNGNENDLIFEKLGKLQELGQPPAELMQKIGQAQFGSGAANPF